MNNFEWLDKKVDQLINDIQSVGHKVDKLSKDIAVHNSRLNRVEEDQKAHLETTKKLEAQSSVDIMSTTRRILGIVVLIGTLFAMMWGCTVLIAPTVTKMTAGEASSISESADIGRFEIPEE